MIFTESVDIKLSINSLIKYINRIIKDVRVGKLNLKIAITELSECINNFNKSRSLDSLEILLNAKMLIDPDRDISVETLQNIEIDGDILIATYLSYNAPPVDFYDEVRIVSKVSLKATEWKKIRTRILNSDDELIGLIIIE